MGYATMSDYQIGPLTCQSRAISRLLVTSPDNFHSHQLQMEGLLQFWY